MNLECDLFKSLAKTCYLEPRSIKVALCFSGMVGLLALRPPPLFTCSSSCTPRKSSTVPHSWHIRDYVMGLFQLANVVA